ncbi:MAG: hypothetical protein U0800_06090 [Isosphaeraceae bacterium]
MRHFLVAHAHACLSHRKARFRPRPVGEVLEVHDALDGSTFAPLAADLSGENTRETTVRFDGRFRSG